MMASDSNKEVQPMTIYALTMQKTDGFFYIHYVSWLTVGAVHQYYQYVPASYP